MTIIFITVGKNPLEEMEQLSQSTRVQNAVLGCNLKNDRIISVRFQGKPFNITVIQVYALTSNAEEAEVERFYENPQDLLELTPKRDVVFITVDWNVKVGSQEIPGVIGKFGLEVQNEAGQRLTEFCFKKQRLFFLPTKVHLVKAMIFPVVMYGCEGWTKKKAEH